MAGELKGVTTHEKGVELGEQCLKVDCRVLDDPVKFPARTSDVAIETHRDLVADTGHGEVLHVD